MTDAGLTDVVSLAPLQEGLLFHAVYDGTHGGDSGDAYTVQLVLGLSGPVDPAAFRAAGEALLRRHANLRAGFRFGRSGQPVQVLPRAVELPWREVDLSCEEAASQQLIELVRAEREHGFDLARPPALRLALVRLGDGLDGGDYRLVLTSHHILIDGWSTPLLARELLTLYTAGGDESALPPVTPYRDYLAWLRAQDREAACAAWDRALEGLEQPTLLARDRDATPGPGAERVTDLPAQATAELEAAARQYGLTLNTVLQGAWALVLAAATGRRDVVFGTTVAVRPAEIPGVEHMVGLLVNTVPVRVRLRPAEALHAALHRLQTEQTELLDSQHLGLADIQRRAGMGELFDTLVVFENHPRDLTDEAVGPLRITGVESYDATHYPLTVVATPGERLRLALYYRTDAVSADEAAALGTRLERALTTFAQEPARPVARTGLVSRDEAARVLDHGAGTGERCMPAGSLPALFEAQAARTPDAPAVRADGHVVSYAELDRRANRLAHRVRAHGVGPERVVALALPRCIEQVVAFLAVQKAGGACLLLDLHHPTDRVASVLTDAAPTLVLTTRTAAPRLPVHPQPDQLLLDGPHDVDAAATDAEADVLRPPEFTDDLRRAAYVVYTSGSTGRPKGVVVTHSGIASLVTTARDRFDVGPGSRVGQFASLGFDIAVWELSMALLSGGCLVVMPSSVRTDVDPLVAFARDEALTVLALPPSLLAALPWDAELPDGLTLVVGSEPVPAELVRRWTSRARVVVAYGVTECTVNQTLWTAPPRWEGRTVPIGTPDPGTQLYVLGPGLLPRPAGEVGELYIGGERLARGYLGRPALTAERFVADPFGPPGSRMYRTGDLVRWSRDGELEFLGRADEQTQIRGFRVEPGEVESVLLRHPEIAAAAVVARRDGPHGSPTRLVAYVVAAADATADVETWRQHAAACLPDAMVPAAFVAIPELPRTANGKLDRDALPAPAAVATASAATPRTAAEEALTRLVGEVLDVEEVGISDDFFSIGGDSISSIVLVSRARREGLGITPREVFEHRTVARLARVARSLPTEASQRQGGDEADVGRLPATPIMAWLAEHGGVINGHNQSLLLQVPAAADLQRLTAVLQAVLDHHAMLRARLIRSAGSWELEVAPPGAVDAEACLHRVDASGCDGDALESLVDEHLAAAKARLDPDAGAMVQAVWFDAGPGRSGRLLCVVHHLVVDGVSWRILVPDLAAAWEAVAAGRSVELEPVPTSFRRWAHGLVEEAHRPGREAELGLWREILQPPDPPLSPVPIDRERDIAATTRHLTRTLSPERTSPLLTEAPATFHAEVNDVLLTALALAVSDWREQRGRTDKGEQGVLLNLEGHGREEIVPGVDLSRTVGWFTSTFPVRLDPGGIDLADALEGGQAAGHALKRVKEQLRALPDKGVGFGLLRYLNDRTREELASLRWPQIGFNYLGRFATASGRDPDPERFSALGQTLSGSVDDDMPVAYVLEINVITRDRDTGPELSVTWSWPSAVLSDEEVRQLADGWFAALDALVTHARAPGAGGHTPSDLSVALSQEDIDELERDFAAGSP